MTSLALELYQVLEDEYVSMYGPLVKPPLVYGKVDILNLHRIREILRECPPLPVAQGDAKAVAAQLSELIEREIRKSPEITDRGKLLEAVAAQLSKLIESETSLVPLRESPEITDRGKRLIDDYANLSTLAKENDGEAGVLELRRKIVDDAFTDAVRPLSGARLDNVYTALHERARGKNGKPRTALCISGGGIRSATFALGVMQGLASAKILDKFDYLSTVSGGGYIGSWLSSWMRRHAHGATGVQKELHQADTAVAGSGDVAPPEEADRPSRRKIAPEPTPLRHLRAYSNYLSPRLGILSGDTWTMASLYIRNLLLNLLVLVPLLACALAFPRIFSWLLWLANDPRQLHWKPVTWGWIAAGLIGIGFAYLGQKRPVVQGERAQRKALTLTTDIRFIFFCVLPLAWGATALAVYWARLNFRSPTQEPLLQGEQIPWGPAIVLFLAMTLVPFVLYYLRVFLAKLPAEQRTSFAAAGNRWTGLGKKIAWESFADLVAVATTAGLLYLLAVKVFDDPMRFVPRVEALAPIERAGLPASPQAQLYACFIVPLLLLVFFVQASIFVGLSSFRNEDYDREWWGRAGGWLLAIAVGLALFNATALFGPVAFYYAPVILGSIGGAAGIASALLGFSGKTPANQREKEEGGTAAKAGNIASAVTVPLFVVALLAAISLGSTWISQQFQVDEEVPSGLPVKVPVLDKDETKIIQPDRYAQAAQLKSRYSQAEGEHPGLKLVTTSPRVSLPALRAVAHLQTIQQTSGEEALTYLGVAALGFLLSYCIGVNKFSMHALYRNRLIRAYLGASRYSRDPDRFTGFDENDNLKMWELRPELLWSASLCDVEELWKAVNDKGNKLGVYLRGELETVTSEALDKKIDYVSTQGLVENLNAILMTRDLRKADVRAPAWTTTLDNQIGYPRAMINRAILDEHFNQWITSMTPPADAAAPASKEGISRGPFHIVNTALNLTSGDNLAWQQRMAESFTVSPYHSGSLFLGYRASREYGGEISLGTAVTISGAAASPNMGYHSSPLMAFLLTFFNIRLGSWLGNPGPHGQTCYQRKHPRSGLIPMFKELTGNSNDTSKWVYLSDGGHFENLGLYEMVVRRCHRIVLSDGGADPDYAFEDLGNAIRKIRTDLGIPIDIGKVTMARRAKDGKPVAGEYFAFATIRYSAVDKNAVDGKLLYIKPGVYQRDPFPWDVYNYAQESLEFPHEPTSDQFFSESQFESYRALGRYAFNDICKSFPVAKTYASVDDFFSSVEQCRAPEIPDSGD